MDVTSDLAGFVPEGPIALSVAAKCFIILAMVHFVVNAALYVVRELQSQFIVTGAPEADGSQPRAHTRKSSWAVIIAVFGRDCTLSCQDNCVVFVTLTCSCFITLTLICEFHACLW